MLARRKVKGVRVTTLEAVCRYLDCHSGDQLATKRMRNIDAAKLLT